MLRIITALFVLICTVQNNSFAQTFSSEFALSYPFPSKLASASNGSKITVTISQKGLRNIYLAETPDFSLRRLIHRAVDGTTVYGQLFEPVKSRR